MERRKWRRRGMLSWDALSVNPWLSLCCRINCLVSISRGLPWDDTLRTSGSFLMKGSKIPMAKFPSFPFRICMKSQIASYLHTIGPGTKFANQNHTENLGSIIPESPWPHYLLSHLEGIPVKENSEVFSHVLHLTHTDRMLSFSNREGTKESLVSMLRISLLVQQQKWDLLVCVLNFWSQLDLKHHRQVWYPVTFINCFTFLKDLHIYFLLFFPIYFFLV